MAVAFIALLLAMGGASYAAVKLPARSVGARELKPRAVTRAAIKANAVDGSKVAADALTGADIKESTLASVPAATSAASSTHAAAAAALDRVTFRGATGSVPPATRDHVCRARGATAGLRRRPGGTAAVSRSRMATPLPIVDSYPTPAAGPGAPRRQRRQVAAHGFSVFAICVAAASVG